MTCLLLARNIDSCYFMEEEVYWSDKHNPEKQKTRLQKEQKSRAWTLSHLPLSLGFSVSLWIFAPLVSFSSSLVSYFLIIYSFMTWHSLYKSHSFPWLTSPRFPSFSFLCFWRPHPRPKLCANQNSLISPEEQCTCPEFIGPVPSWCTVRLHPRCVSCKQCCIDHYRSYWLPCRHLFSSFLIMNTSLFTGKFHPPVWSLDETESSLRPPWFKPDNQGCFPHPLTISTWEHRVRVYIPTNNVWKCPVHCSLPTLVFIFSLLLLVPWN